MSEERSTASVVSHYRKIIRRMDPHRRVEYLLELVATRTAMVRTYAALYKGVKHDNPS